MSQNKDGGRVKKNAIDNKVSATTKCSLIAVPIQKLKKPDLFNVSNIDNFVAKIPQIFNVNLRKSDRSSVREEVKIQKFEDIELEVIIEKSNTLKNQQTEMNFLYRFIDEWRENPSFKEQFVSILEDNDRRQQLIEALTDTRNSLSKNQKPAPLLDFLNSIRD